MRRAGLAVALAAALAGGLSLPARAQMDSREAIALQNQILELRRDVQNLQAQGGGVPASGYRAAPMGGGGAPSDLTAQLLDRVTALEDAVRQLRGRLDEQANANRRAQDDLAKQIGDLSFRLQNGIGGAAPASPQPMAMPGVGPGPAAGPGPQPGALGTVPANAPVRRTPELAMQEGNAALARRDYPAAEAAAREVLANNRGTPRGADANFLLAQALMGQRNFQGAAVAYDDAYNRAHTGSRAPEALLGLANALNGLNDRPSTCATLDKLRTEFPALRPDLRESAAGLRARNGCR